MVVFHDGADVGRESAGYCRERLSHPQFRREHTDSGVRVLASGGRTFRSTLKHDVRVDAIDRSHQPFTSCHPSPFIPSGRSVVDLKPILGLQAPDRFGRPGLVPFGVGKCKARAIDLGSDTRTPGAGDEACPAAQHRDTPVGPGLYGSASRGAWAHAASPLRSILSENRSTRFGVGAKEPGCGA